jgi:tetratricopeptide (TPR) repeat protein
VLSYAAAMGMEFDCSVLEIASEMGEEPLAESLERLVHRGILKELKGGDSYAFVQIVVLAEAYRAITSARVRVIHRKIAEAYEKLYPEPTPQVIPEIGRQFFLGRVHEKSILYNRYAAALAVNAFSPEVAVRYLERVREDLAVMPGDHRVEKAEILKEIGEQYSAIGDDSKADEFFGESLKKLPEEDVTLRALILLSRADAARENYKFDAMRKYCKEAIRLFAKTGHGKGLAMTYRTLSRAAFKEGQFEVSKKQIEAALSFLDPEKDAKDVARCYIELSNVISSMPDPSYMARAVEYYRKAIRMLEPLSDYSEIARAHINIAICIGEAEPREALKELMEARDCCEKAKNKRLLGWLLVNSVEFHIALDEGIQAAENNTEARRILSKINDTLGLQQVALNEGILAQHKQSYEEAEKAYLSSLKLAEDLGYRQVIIEVEVLMHLAMMYADWGKNAEAVKSIARIKELGEDDINPTDRPAYENLKKLLGE